jgi:uncharacterized protein (TIGR00255 family)
MIKSMTGYGKGETPYNNGRIVIEIRSVNHRYGEISVKLPRIFMQYENEVKKLVASVLKRGKIDVFAQLEGVASAIGLPTVNLALAGSYHKAFINIKEALGLNDEVSLRLIATQKDVITISEIETACEPSGHELLAAVRTALDNLDAMRLREGAALENELLKRRGILTDLVVAITVRVPRLVTTYADKLKERVALLMADSGLAEERLAQEVALMADRTDITEELVRFDSHMKQFDAIMMSSEPVGRKLDFLLQEVNREVNTIGSKANDVEIASLIIEMKAELEKIREQVQNIE